MRAKYAIIGIVVGVLLSSAAIVLAGSLDPPSGPTDARSQMYTLEQVYNRVDDGSTARKMSSFTEPKNSPGDTMHTLDQLYALVGQRAPVPGTGQTTSYAGGDDGDLMRGVNWPNPRFIDNGDGTVTDKLTGLMWLQDGLCMSTAGWTTMLTRISNLNTDDDPGCYNYTAKTYSDWRMPNRFEMTSLIDLSEDLPALTTGHPFISITSTGGFWSSTTYADDPVYAWYVDMDDGDTAFKNKSLAAFALPVRGGH